MSNPFANEDNYGKPDVSCFVCDAHCGRDLSDTSDPKMHYHFCSTDCRAEFRSECKDADLLSESELQDFERAVNEQAIVNGYLDD